MEHEDITVITGQFGVLANFRQPDFVLASGTPHEIRITPDAVLFNGGTVEDAGKLYTLMIAALNTLVNPRASTPDRSMPEHALRKLCDQLAGMKRRLLHTPGTGQHHSYLIHEDVEAYVEEARKALAAQPAEGSAQVAKAPYSHDLDVFRYTFERSAKGTQGIVNMLRRKLYAAPERSDTPAGLDKLKVYKMAKTEVGHPNHCLGEFVRLSDVQALFATPTAASQALDAAAPAAEGATPAGEWVSVDERLPEKDGNVLVAFWPYNNRENEQVAEMAYYSDGSFLHWERCAEMHPPSHWMSLNLPRIDGDKQGAGTE